MASREKCLKVPRAEATSPGVRATKLPMFVRPGACHRLQGSYCFVGSLRRDAMREREQSGRRLYH